MVVHTTKKSYFDYNDCGEEGMIIENDESSISSTIPVHNSNNSTHCCDGGGDVVVDEDNNDDAINVTKKCVRINLDMSIEYDNHQYCMEELFDEIKYHTWYQPAEYKSFRAYTKNIAREISHSDNSCTMLSSLPSSLSSGGSSSSSSSGFSFFHRKNSLSRRSTHIDKTSSSTAYETTMNDAYRYACTSSSTCSPDKVSTIQKNLREWAISNDGVESKTSFCRVGIHKYILPELRQEISMRRSNNIEMVLSMQQDYMWNKFDVQSSCSSSKITLLSEISEQISECYQIMSQPSKTFAQLLAQALASSIEAYDQTID